MKIARKMAGFAVALSWLMAGCATHQDITKLEQYRPKEVCIVKDDKVFEGVLEAIQDGFRQHAIDTRVVNGTYQQKHAMWHPVFSRSDTAGCDALLFYVANWSWDLAYYMYFANIWMTNADGSKKVAQATYDASHNIGVGKFVVAKDKIRELVDQMLASTPSFNNTGNSPLPVRAPNPPAMTRTSHNPDATSRLEQLEDLHKKGLISDSEYAAKRRAILDQL